jgi:hypothetical protein
MPFSINCLRKNDWLRPVISASSLNLCSIIGSTRTAMTCDRFPDFLLNLCS